MLAIIMRVNFSIWVNIRIINYISQNQSCGVNNKNKNKKHSTGYPTKLNTNTWWMKQKREKIYIKKCSSKFGSKFIISKKYKHGIRVCIYIFSDNSNSTDQKLSSLTVLHSTAQNRSNRYNNTDIR